MRKVLSISAFLFFALTSIAQNVGIGVPNPGAKLQVAGGVKISDSLNVEGLVRITSGSPGEGKVLTSDAMGLASWTTRAVGFSHHIGEQFGGGVIFHLWKDASKVEHGLIVATTNQSTGQAWSNVSNSLIGVSAESSWDGLSNSTAIIGQGGHTSSAAKLCLDLVSDGQGDWYLPSIDELFLLWQNRFDITKSLSSIEGAVLFEYGSYWSSTEAGPAIARCFEVSSGGEGYQEKATAAIVRAVRAF